MLPAVGSSLIPGLLHQSWSWQLGDLLGHVKVTKTNKDSRSSLGTGLRSLDHHSEYRLIYWFCSSYFYQLQDIMTAEIIALLILFRYFPLFHFMLIWLECWHNSEWQKGAGTVGQFLSVNPSTMSPGLRQSLSCPVLFDRLLPVQTCVCPFLSFHVLTCPILSCPFHLDLLPQRGTTLLYQPSIKSK